MLNTIETKVIAAAAGAGGGGAVSGFLLWLLGVTVWGVPSDATHATQAVAAVPMPVALVAAVALSVAGAAAGGYRAPHTPRPDLAPAPAVAGPGAAVLSGLFANPVAPAPVDAVSVPVAAVGDVPLSPGDVVSSVPEAAPETAAVAVPEVVPPVPDPVVPDVLVPPAPTV